MQNVWEKGGETVSNFVSECKSWLKGTYIKDSMIFGKDCTLD